MKHSHYLFDGILQTSKMKYSKGSMFLNKIAFQQQLTAFLRESLLNFYYCLDLNSIYCFYYSYHLYCYFFVNFKSALVRDPLLLIIYLSWFQKKTTQLKQIIDYLFLHFFVPKKSEEELSSEGESEVEYHLHLYLFFEKSSSSFTSRQIVLV